MPNDAPVAQDDLIPTLIERIKQGTADGLGFDALLKQRIDEHWKSIGEERIETFIDKKVDAQTEAEIKKATDRLAKIVGIIGTGAILTALIALGARVYNLGRMEDVAKEILAAVQKDDSQLSTNFKDLIKHFADLRGRSAEDMEQLKTEVGSEHGRLVEIGTSLNKLRDAVQTYSELPMTAKTTFEAVGRLQSQIQPVEKDMAAVTVFAGKVRAFVETEGDPAAPGWLQALGERWSQFTSDVQIEPEQCENGSHAAGQLKYRRTSPEQPGTPSLGAGTGDEQVVLICLGNGRQLVSIGRGDGR